MKKKTNVILVVCIALYVLLQWVPLMYIMAEDIVYRDSLALVKAIRAQDIEKTEKLLKKGTDPNRLSGKVHFYSGLVSPGPSRPLSEACFTGNLKLVQLLIEYGATAECSVDDYARSPLYAALSEYHPDDLQIVRLLLEHGAEINEQRKEHTPEPVFQAAGIWVNRRGAYDDEAAKCAVELVDLLLDGRTVNLRSENCGGSTLILNAASVGNRDLVEYLISRGADPYLTNDYGTNAVDCAKEYGYSDILALMTAQNGEN